MAKNTGAYIAALLGGFAKGKSEQLDKQDEFNRELGKLLIAQKMQQQSAEREMKAKRQQQALDKFIEVEKAGRKQIIQTPQGTQTFEGLPASTLGTLREKAGEVYGADYPSIPTGAPAGQRGQVVGGRTSADMVKFKQQASNLDATLAQIDMLEEKYNKLKNAGKIGLGPDTAKAYLGGKLSQDPDAKDYLSLKEGLTAYFGRNIGNDVGNFAEKEARYYSNLTPGFIDNPDSGAQQFQTLRDIVKSRKGVLYSTYGQPLAENQPGSAETTQEQIPTDEINKLLPNVDLKGAKIRRIR